MPDNLISQEEIFWDGEGNKWFARNRTVLDAPEHVQWDPPLRLMKEYGIAPGGVLEIGCSNGWRLGEIAKRYHCKCVGVEPSESAIKDGRAKYPDVEFHRGLGIVIPASVVPPFDLVIVNFVLHWVSRNALLKTVAEIDRCVADGGFLIVGDFAPDHPTKNSYHHLLDGRVFTWKLNYSKILEATALYSPVACMTFDHDDRDYQPAPAQRRGNCCLMKKSLSEFYIG